MFSLLLFFSFDCFHSRSNWVRNLSAGQAAAKLWEGNRDKFIVRGSSSADWYLTWSYFTPEGRRQTQPTSAEHHRILCTPHGYCFADGAAITNVGQYQKACLEPPESEDDVYDTLSELLKAYMNDDDDFYEPWIQEMTDALQKWTFLESTQMAIYSAPKKTPEKKQKEK